MKDVSFRRCQGAGNRVAESSVVASASGDGIEGIMDGGLDLSG